MRTGCAVDAVTGEVLDEDAGAPHRFLSAALIG